MQALPEVQVGFAEEGQARQASAGDARHGSGAWFVGRPGAGGDQGVDVPGATCHPACSRVLRHKAGLGQDCALGEGQRGSHAPVYNQEYSCLPQRPFFVDAHDLFTARGSMFCVLCAVCELARRRLPRTGVAGERGEAARSDLVAGVQLLAVDG